MKEEEIRDILNSHQICFAQHGTLCATVKAGIGAYQNGLGEIMHTMKDHILHILSLIHIYQRRISFAGSAGQYDGSVCRGAGIRLSCQLS